MLQETADGELVVFHDDTLQRAASNKGVNAAPAAQLQEGATDFASFCQFVVITEPVRTLAAWHKLWRQHAVRRSMLGPVNAAAGG